MKELAARSATLYTGTTAGPESSRPRLASSVPLKAETSRKCERGNRDSVVIQSGSIWTDEERCNVSMQRRATGARFLDYDPKRDSVAQEVNLWQRPSLTEYDLHSTTG